MADNEPGYSSPSTRNIPRRNKATSPARRLMIPIETPAVNWVKKPYVKGLYPNPASLFAWKFVYIERDPSKWDYATPSLTD